jgi:Xaa-Pro aminopeptidase
MQVCQPGLSEQQVQAEMEYVFRKMGSTYNAYPSIVAGGENSCILHYIDNNEVLNDGDLLLIDAGAELDCYASDISRTFPVNGKFSGEQKALYEIVLAAQKAAFEVCETGQHWNRPHERAVEIITEGLLDVGLLNGELNELIETAAYRDFYMHRTGHWLGMDVHDVGEYQIDQQWRLLEPGMVFTVEPGIYVGRNSNVDSRWHDIGIRIEDDVVIKQAGHDILTSDVPSSVDDIEHLMTQ